MRSVATGSVNQSIVFHAFDEDEAAVTLAFDSPGLSISYVIDANGREGTPVALTPIARDVAGTHQDGAITSKGDGKHEVDLPDVAISAGYVRLIVEATAVTGRVYSEVLAVGQAVELDSSALDPVLEAIAEINAGGLTTEQAEQLDNIEAAVIEAPVTVNNFGQFDDSGALILKRGHTATITFTSTTNNIVPDMSDANTKVFFGIYDTGRRKWLQVEGTKVTNTGLQSISFTIPADKAAAMYTGVHLFDAVVVYGYTASTGPDDPATYTALRPFASGNVRVRELSLDLTAL